MSTEFNNITSEDTEIKETLASAEAPVDKTDEASRDKPKKSKNIDSFLREFIERCGIPQLALLRLIAVYFIYSGIGVVSASDNPISSWKLFILNSELVPAVLKMAAGFVILSAICFFLPKKMRFTDHIAAASGVMLFSIAVVWRCENFYLCMAVSALAVVFISYITGKTDLKALTKFPSYLSATVIAVFSVAVALFIAVFTVARHRVFGTACYDFGIFVQMFHSMVTDFTAETTCERGYEVSHFYIHASYIYYLLAPFYAVFRSEETLLIAQAILAMGGVIPLFLIAKNHNYKGFALTAICLMYVFCPGIICPCRYDFHENAFLPTLLMWTLYAVDKRNYKLMYIMSALVCIVKEDAPLYIMCIAVFIFFDEKSKNRLHGVILAILSAIYFFGINNWLSLNGDGSIMLSSRFGNLTANADDNLADIIKNVLVNPGYFFSLTITEDTLLFFLQIMVPLLFMPFMTRKLHRYLLMIPFIIMNLVVGSGYGYAADIGFQYIFGPVSLLIYMTVINCENFTISKKHIAAFSAAAASVICSVGLSSDDIRFYEIYTNNRSFYDSVISCLDSVPEDASVAVNTTWYVSHLAQRDEIYYLKDNDYAYLGNKPAAFTVDNPEQYDFFVLNEYDANSAQVKVVLEDAGFSYYDGVEGSVCIYVNPDYSTSPLKLPEKNNPLD